MRGKDDGLMLRGTGQENTVTKRASEREGGLAQAAGLSVVVVDGLARSRSRTTQNTCLPSR